MTTRISLLRCCCANFSASADMSSFEPSSTMVSSYVRVCRMEVELIVVLSIDGRRDISLYAGMMTLRSMEPTSARDGRVRGSLRNFRKRYVFF
ncbi:hypothetical protein BDR03DRAFT_940042 [Suillus americanus]|nr:hypothetical protein BDR03DRAFT_940042 [Suillus americanus]